MKILDRYLLTLLGLAGLAGLAISLPGGEGELLQAALVHELPPRFDGWAAVEGVPEEILPSDPRALETVRRTYAKEGHTVFLAVGRYRSLNDPQRRPSFDLIVLERGAISVERDLYQIALDGLPGRVIPVHLLLLRRPERQVSVVYWYQLGEQTVAGEYRFRIALLLDTLLFRRRELFLVRLATIGNEWPEAFLRALYPQLIQIVSPHRGEGPE